MIHRSFRLSTASLYLLCAGGSSACHSSSLAEPEKTTVSQRPSAPPQPSSPSSPSPGVSTIASDAGSANGSAPNVLSIAAPSGHPSALVVVLHGVGDSAAGIHHLARMLSRSAPQADFLTPDGFEPFDQQAQPGAARQWFSLRGVTDENRAPRVRQAAERVSSWIDGELDKRGLGHDRVAVVGFSQGAMITSWLAIHRSPTPLAAIVLSGRVADDQAPVPGSVSTPVFMAHGTKDPVIPPSVVEPGARLLSAWGAKVTTRMVPGLAHGIDGGELREAGEFLAGALAAKP